jgi:C-terminal processing protease CtpA/Prc
MKRLLMPWLALALLLGQSALAQTQEDPQAKPTNPDQNAVQDPSQACPQSGANLGVVQALTDQINLSYSAIPGAQSLATWTADTVWWDRANQTAGLSLTPVDDALRAHLHLSKDQGLVVTSLPANAPAAQAGLQQNDVLLKLGDASLAKAEDLEEGLKGSGDKPASLTVLRGGKSMTIQVQPRTRVTMGPVQPEPPAYWIGISVSELEPALRSQLKLPEHQGLLATEVHKDSAAAKAEVKVYDILLSLADQPLDSQQKLIDVVQAIGEKTVPLQLIREGKTLTIEVSPQRRKLTQVHFNLNLTNPQTYSYQVVRPGVMYANPAYGGGGSTGALTLGQAPETTQQQEATAKVSKRLDDLDSEIKHLRKAIEELSAVLKDKK